MRLDRSYEIAREITKKHAKSFYFSSIGLPSKKKPHAYAVYAFCRYVDDVVDESSSPESLSQVLNELRSFVQRIFRDEMNSGDREKCPWVMAFQDTVKRCDIPEKYFFDLLHGVEMDQGEVELQTWEELKEYCYYVASVVGLMMTRVFELKDRKYEEQAVDLGIAMQLTNILRDVREDYERGRIYLPSEELKKFEVTKEEIRDQVLSEKWKALMRFQIERARSYYVKSEEGIRALPQDGSQLTVWLMRDIYSGILEEIEGKDYNVFEGRVYVSFPRKCILGVKSWLKS